jgi:hypothetical protein
MAQKTFKIGESCRGGVLTAIATKDKVSIIGKEWDTSAGYNKSSNQSNAKEFTRLEVQTNDRNARRKISEFLEDLTTYYYSEKVIEWVESQTTFKPSFGW